MILLVNLVVLVAIFSTTEANNATQIPSQAKQKTSQSKTKRTIGDLQNYGESKPVLVFVDNVASPSSNIPTFYTNPKALVLKPVFETDIPKQVAAQQVLYEFQQTPTNAVSNVHVNQLFQPFDFPKESSNAQVYSTESPVARQPYARGTVPNQQSIQTSETIASPVQHAALINHGQNYAHVHFQPLPPPGTPQHIQTHHYIPGKYLYVNGKIIYQPSPVASVPTPNQFNQQNFQQQNQQVHQQQHQQPQPQQQHPQGFNQNQNSLSNTAPQSYHHINQPHIQNVNKQRPVNYITYHNTRVPKQNLTPPPKVAPIGYQKFQPPTRLQQITKPMPSPAPASEQEEDADEDEEKAPVKEEESEELEDDEDGEPRSNYKEDDDEDERRDSYEDRPARYYGRYRYEDDEDDESDHQNYQRDDDEIEEDDDNDRGSSKVVTTKTRKHPRKKSHKKHGKQPKYDESNNYKYSESYGSKTEYKSPSKRSKKGKSKNKSNKPNGYYKTVKYSKKDNGKPKIETIEGRQSQHVPVIEKRKVFQERWVVSKSTDALAA